MFFLKVVFLFLGSVFGPQYLGMLRNVVSNPPDWKNWRQVCICVLLVAYSPLYTYVEHLKLSYMQLKLKLSPNEESIIREIETLKRSLNMHIKLELGLETVYQLAGQLILLLPAYTETGTQTGLTTVFNERLDPWPLFLLISSIFLSFYSCISSHWKALTACREHFPTKSRFTSAIYCLFGCLTRVIAIIIFFAGPLGLFDLLKHLQGEQYPWHANTLALVSPNGYMALANGKLFKWNSVDRWQNYYEQHENGTFKRNDNGFPIPNPSHLVTSPDYTLYVGVRLRHYLWIFFASIVIQMLVIFIAKSLLSKVFWNKFNFLEKLIHCLENSNIPYNSKEWDDGKGDAKEHERRMKSNWFEVLAVMIINGVFNSLLLSSLGYLGNYFAKEYKDCENLICILRIFSL